ncbi:MAG: ferrochelatase [Myxococcota bacterium]
MPNTTSPLSSRPASLTRSASAPAAAKPSEAQKPAAKVASASPAATFDAVPGSTAPTAPRLGEPAPGGMSVLGARIAQVAKVGDGESAPPPKVGVLLTSHGDIDDPKSELREYVREAVMKNPGLPLPKWIRPAVDKLGWPLQKDSLFDQYEQIGPTKYDENSRKQADALTKALGELGIEGKAYVGYNFLPPFIDDAVKQMKEDGITHIVVFNQGAQNSVATMGESVDELHQALEKFPDWQVKATAVMEFNDDDRFVKLLGDSLQRDVNEAFPGHKPEETLLLVTSHGLPQHLIDKGDPATADMMATFAKLKERFGALGYQIEHGYLNDDFFPGATWTEPKAEERVNMILEEVFAKKRVAPKNVLLDGRLSFTVHHRATMYDANVVARGILEEPAGAPWARFPGAEVKLAPNFDGDAGLASLYANLTKEALEGRAENVEVIRE